MKRTADDADIDFEAMFGLPKRGAVVEDELNDSPAGDKDDESTKNKDKNSKLSRYVHHTGIILSMQSIFTPRETI